MPSGAASKCNGDALSGATEPALGTVHDEVHVGWLVTDTARLLRTVFDRRVRGLGLTRPQWLAIVRLKRRPGASQSELADMMEIEKAPAGRIVDRMEEKSLIERRAHPADRRINRIYLTLRGERLFDAISPLSEQTVQDALSELSAREQEVLTHLLSRVKTTLAGFAESDPQPELSWPLEAIESSGEDQETQAI